MRGLEKSIQSKGEDGLSNGAGRKKKIWPERKERNEKKKKKKSAPSLRLRAESSFQS